MRADTSDEPRPRISVCVATYRRPQKLARLLECLEQQEPPEGGFEIVVVDDGSPPEDGVTRVLAQAATRLSVPVKWRSLADNSGRAAARNATAAMASGDWIVFTDDDCMPDRRWLVGLLDAASTSEADGQPVDVVQGRVVPDPERTHLLSHPLARSLRVDRFNELYQTANIAYRRSLFDALGGFDERFAGSCEDADLGRRALKNGSAAAFAPEATVVHEVVIRSFAEDLRDRRRWADVMLLLVDHPEIRELGWNRYVYRRTHLGPAVIMATFPVVFAGRRGMLAWAAVVAGVFGSCLRGARSPSDGLARIQCRVADVYETAAFLASAVRNRQVAL